MVKIDSIINYKVVGMKIVIAGTGYVGLVTGACFSEIGIDVTCVDIDKKKIENLQKGIIPIYEPGLEKMVQRNIAKGRLHFHTKLSECLDGVQVVFGAVGTPPDEDGSADLTICAGSGTRSGCAYNRLCFNGH